MYSLHLTHALTYCCAKWMSTFQAFKENIRSSWAWPTSIEGITSTASLVTL